MLVEDRYHWMQCVIENAGFKSERKFEVDLASSGKVVGTAYIEYLRHSDGTPLKEDEPPYGKQIQGKVRCRVVRREGAKVFVEFPGTDVFHVPQEALAES